MRGAWTTLGLLLAAGAGCLGTDHTFPDATGDVRALHVNAFEATTGEAPHPALVQVSGLAADGQERAFHGALHLSLEKALHPEKDVAYEPVRAYDADVSAQEFSTPTVPYWTLTIPPADLPEDATYRVVVTARLPGHDPLEASALFAYAR